MLEIPHFAAFGDFIRNDISSVSEESLLINPKLVKSLYILCNLLQ